MRPLYLLEKKNTQTKHQNLTQYSKQMQKLIKTLHQIGNISYLYVQAASDDAVVKDLPNVLYEPRREKTNIVVSDQV